MLTNGMRMFLVVGIFAVVSSIASFLSGDSAAAYHYLAVTAALLPISLLVVRFRDFESPTDPEHVTGHASELQVPPPSIWPPCVALGVGVATVGFVVDGFLAVYGLLLVMAAAAGWLTATRLLDMAWRSGERVEPDEPGPMTVVTRLRAATRALSLAGMAVGVALMFVGLSRSRLGETVLGFIVLAAVITAHSIFASTERSNASLTDPGH